MERQSSDQECTSNLKSQSPAETTDKDINDDQDSSEEVEVFIGPATSRLPECENPPIFRPESKAVGKPLRRKLNNTVCRFFLSSNGCQRDNCLWKHENPGDSESEFKSVAPLNMETPQKAGKLCTMRTKSYFDVKIKELEFENSELSRRNLELENEFLDLKSRTKDITFVREENYRLRRLLKRYGYDKDYLSPGDVRGGHIAYYPSRRRSTRYISSYDDYRPPHRMYRHWNDFPLHGTRSHRPLRPYFSSPDSGDSRLLIEGSRESMSEPEMNYKA